MKAAIMQPTYLPWMGYFALMDQVDEFVFLDSVQFTRRSWQQRNRIKSPQGEHCLTIPVFKKGLRDQLIKDVVIDKSSDYARDHMMTIKLSYAQAPYFKEYHQEIFSIFERGHERLADLTIDLIVRLKDVLGIKTKCLKSSDLNIDGKKDGLLSDICLHLKVDHYVSPVGSKVYLLDSPEFTDKHIQVSYNEYQHPEYHQLFGSFLPYMSVIDLLFNEGPKSLEIIRSGITKTSATHESHP